MSSLRLAVAAAIAASPLSARPADGPIQDNGFIIEEAYNQEPGVIQHISTFNRSIRTGAWGYSFTEEWPVLGQTHQVSATFTAAGLEAPGASGVGDLALNYRWQAVGDGEAPVALAPRLTLLLPTGDASRGLGAGGAGLQVNLPVSATLSRRFAAHSNVGGTYIFSARAPSGGRGRLSAVAAGQSLVWLAFPRLNFLVEVLYTRSGVATGAGTERSETLTLNPGVRAALDFASGLQIVPGLSVPVGLGASRGEIGISFYLSFEHPFRPAGPTEERSESSPSPHGPCTCPAAASENCSGARAGDPRRETVRSCAPPAAGVHAPPWPRRPAAPISSPRSSSATSAPA